MASRLIFMMFQNDHVTLGGLKEGVPSSPKLKVNHFEFQKLHDDQYNLLHFLMHLIS